MFVPTAVGAITGSLTITDNALDIPQSVSLTGTAITRVPGDFDGDGKTDFAVRRPSNGTWYIIPSSAPSSPIFVQGGIEGDLPIEKPIGQ